MKSKFKIGKKFRGPDRHVKCLSIEFGGALGWKGKGDLDPEFEKVAFEMEASTTTKPKYREGCGLDDGMKQIEGLNAG
ncbi:hypothetical protein SS1G_00065 [Sclerotinia sclerotiorum 1980 UF-70]|uniref:Peptidyl-prolyl cis-trans isomerase n=1 Tax=Sclerotinia sclerotiorum (strain ATCC 18683 / 1980 / Ss-1) TaxID=665079 RepID=A7E443_SCLS1|nr:hypothetical protein SS1G_00065 [Sclerotinia sclerotiorum 1980 UF-70]EDN90665.1 hypothetical protein SS1G_00065 [Sclerotinia sclerotiorum 1980 UF-70]